MNYNLKDIFQAINSIQTALLRFKNEDGQQNLHVKLACSDDNSIDCVVAADISSKLRIRNRNIHLIQKYKDDYFFISGHVSGEVKRNPRVLSIAVEKASWFVRKKKGNLTWLQEKYTYENQHPVKAAS